MGFVITPWSVAFLQEMSGANISREVLKRAVAEV